MSNSSAIIEKSVINNMIRPRRYFITSDSIDDFVTSSHALYNIQEGLVAEDGFSFAFGLCSIGFNSTAFNISETQGNNKLIYKLYYKKPLYIPSGNPNTAGEYHYEKNPNKDDIESVEKTIIIPNGYYNSLSDLFAYLNDDKNIFIGSKIYSDIHADPENDSFLNTNEIPIKFKYSLNSSTTGYIITMQLGYTYSNRSLKNYYPDNDVSLKGLEAYFVQNRIFSMEILPHKDSELYNLLFTNNTSFKNQAPNAPNFISDTGLVNPPRAIVFALQHTLSSSQLPTVTDPYVDFGTVNTTIDNITYGFTFYVENDPNKNIRFRIANESDHVIRSDLTNYPFVSYFLPRLNPLYIDIQSDLETNNFTDSGSNKNVLIRQFLPNMQNGATDFYESWDNPVWHATNRRNINSISISFNSEGNKFNFFNLLFVIQLVIFEYPESQDFQNLNDEVFQLPSEDPLTMQLNEYIGPSYNPQSVAGASEKRGVFTINDKNKRLKSKR